jgi:hypothetical protein
VNGVRDHAGATIIYENGIAIFRLIRRQTSRRRDAMEFVDETPRRRRDVLSVPLGKNMYLYEVRGICDFVKGAHLAMHL